MEVTIHSVAKKAKVSVSTASRILNGGTKGMRRDAAARAEQVWDAARLLGYRPNRAARSLVMKKTWTIGLIATEIDNPVRSRLIEKLRERLQANGFQLLVSGATTGKSVDDQINMMMAQRVDGLLLAGLNVTHYECVRNLFASDFPVTGFSHSATNVRNHILIDYFELAGCLTGHLIEAHGLKDIVFCGYESSCARSEGYRQAMLKYGLGQHIRYLNESAFTLRAGRRLAQRINELSCRPEAIIAHNDLLAIGIIAGLRDLGLGVPDNIAVIGLDNIDMAEYTNPTLTSAGVDLDRLADIMVSLLLELLGGENVKEWLPTRCQGNIFFRESCGCKHSAGKPEDMPRNPH